MKIPVCSTCKAKYVDRHCDPCQACHLIPKEIENKTYWIPNNYEAMSIDIEI